jgi:hypothetical protein
MVSSKALQVVFVHLVYNSAIIFGILLLFILVACEGLKLRKSASFYTDILQFCGSVFSYTACLSPPSNLSLVLTSGTAVFCKDQLFFRWYVAPLSRFIEVTVLEFNRGRGVRISALTLTDCSDICLGFPQSRPRPLLVLQLVFPLSVLYFSAV